MKRILLSAALALCCLMSMANKYENGFDDAWQCYFQDELSYRFTDDTKSAMMFVDPIHYSLIHWDSYTFYNRDNIAEHVNMYISPSVMVEGNEYPVVAIDRSTCNMAEVRELYIPASVKSIGEESFLHCPYLYNIDFHPGLETIGSDCFTGLDNLSSVKLPSTLRDLGSKSFNNCRSLISVSIPAGLQKFEGCFNNCRYLETVYCEIAEPWDITEGWDNFNSVSPATCTLYVPEGKTSEYKAKGWDKYFTIRAIDTNISQSAVEEISSPTDAENATPRYFLPSGIEVSADALVPGSLYIRCKGTKTEKIIIPAI